MARKDLEEKLAKTNNTFAIRNNPMDFFMTIRTPKLLNRNTVGFFLKNIEFIFQEKSTFPLVIIFEKRSEMKYLGYLIIYAILRYSTTEKVASSYFFFGPDRVQKELVKNGFGSLYAQYSNAKFEGSKLSEFNEDKFFIFPQSIEENIDTNQEKLIDELINKINNFYTRHEKGYCVGTIGFCIAEILSNFWAHANDKQSTIILAEGTRSTFSLKILDNGCGIVSSMANVYPEDPPTELLSKSLEKGASSKARKVLGSHHMGEGLYWIAQIVKNNIGFLDIWSEGFHCRVHKNSISTDECGYWQGAIFDLELDLKKFTTLASIKRTEQ